MNDYSLARPVFLPRRWAAAGYLALSAEIASQRERFLGRVLHNGGTPRSRNGDWRGMVRQ